MGPLIFLIPRDLRMSGFASFPGPDGLTGREKGLTNRSVARYGSLPVTMTDVNKREGDCSVAGILIKTVLWLAVGVGRRPRRGGDALATLRHEVERLKSGNTILRERLRGDRQTHHTWKEKLHILWHMEVFDVPRRQVETVFGIRRRNPKARTESTRELLPSIRITCGLWI